MDILNIILDIVFEFKKKISNISIPNNYTIISLDAVSMYTNISWNLIRKPVKERWNQIKTHTFLKQTHFDNILQFCLNLHIVALTMIFISKFLVYQWDHLYQPLLQTLSWKNWKNIFF